METGDIAPETREMSKVRESKGQEEKRDARIRKVGKIGRTDVDKVFRRKASRAAPHPALLPVKTCFPPACSRENPHPMHAQESVFGPSARRYAQARLHAEFSFPRAAHAVTFKPFRTQRSAQALAPRRADAARKTVAPPGMTLEKLLRSTIDNAPAFPCDARETKKPEATIVASGRHIVFRTTSEN